MAVKLILQSISNPALQYEVVGFDPKTKIATLAGGTYPGQLEVLDFTKETMTRRGYRLIKQEVQDGNG
jgi:hypothetical protein